MIIFSKRIESNESGTSVYVFLKRQGFSERMVKSLRKILGQITINGENSTTASVLNSGDLLSLELQHESLHSTPSIACIKPTHSTLHNTTESVLSHRSQLDIVFEDEWMLIVNKPSGLSCMPTRSHYDCNLGKQILDYLSLTTQNPVLRLPSRLDKDTSGLVFAYKSQILFSLFKESPINKTYVAVVHGEVLQQTTIDKPIQTVVQNGRNLQKRVVSDNGKFAFTQIAPLVSTKNFSIVEATIKTGRTHQIRLHCSHIGFPLVGDKLYGTESNQLSHAALVCKKCEFVHPISKQIMCFEVPFPKDIIQFINNNNLCNN